MCRYALQATQKAHSKVNICEIHFKTDGQNGLILCTTVPCTIFADGQLEAAAQMFFFSPENNIKLSKDNDAYRAATITK